MAQVALALSTLFSVGVLALGIAVATLLAGVGWARKREARTVAALEAAQAVEPHKQPMRYLLFLLHLHRQHVLRVAVLAVPQQAATTALKGCL